MINEIKIAEDLLNGKGIGKDCIYAHVYTLAKYYLQQGMDVQDVRKSIFDWATKHKIWLDCDNININQVIYKASKDDRPLRGNETVVRISENDIMNIRYTCDSPKVQLTALAFLCYAKAVDSDTFPMSITSLHNWLKVSTAQLYKAYLPELITFEYIEKVSDTKQDKKTKAWNWSWADKTAIKAQAKDYRLLVPFVNEGEHILKDNDIQALYKECFGK